MTTAPKNLEIIKRAALLPGFFSSAAELRSD